MLSLAEARARILERAEPGEAIEVPLTEALGLVLAEPAVARRGPAAVRPGRVRRLRLRAADAPAGGRLRVVGRRRGAAEGDGRGRVAGRGGAGHGGRPDAGRGRRGRPDRGHPPRARASGRPGWSRSSARSEPGQERRPARRITSARGPSSRRPGPGSGLPMVGLLAAQGCVHPVCHRRVRVAVLAVGDHLVGPGEAPVLHRERNAAGADGGGPLPALGRHRARPGDASPRRDLDAALGPRPDGAGGGRPGRPEGADPPGAGPRGGRAGLLGRLARSRQAAELRRRPRDASGRVRAPRLPPAARARSPP